MRDKQSLKRAFGRPLVNQAKAKNLPAVEHRIGEVHPDVGLRTCRRQFAHSLGRVAAWQQM